MSNKHVIYTCNICSSEYWNFWVNWCKKNSHLAQDYKKEIQQHLSTELSSYYGSTFFHSSQRKLTWKELEIHLNQKVLEMPSHNLILLSHLLTRKEWEWS